MTDFADLNIDGHESIELAAARNGDFAPLWAKLRSDRHLNDLERKFIADKLENKPEARVKSGTKATLQVLDILVLTDYNKLRLFYGAKKTDARDLLARHIYCAKEGKDNGNVRQRIDRAKKLGSDPIRIAEEIYYKMWCDGLLGVEPGETFEHDGKIFEMPEKPKLWLEGRSREEIENLKTPYKKGLPTSY